MTFRDRFKSWAKYYRLNQSVFFVFAGFLTILVLGSLVALFMWWSRLRQPAEVVEPQPEQSVPVVQELPTGVTYTQTESGEVVPDGLPVTYVVQPGDSTWNIAKAFYGSGQNYLDIEVANGLEPDQMLEVGQELLLPSVPVRGEFEFMSDPVPTPTPIPTESLNQASSEASASAQVAEPGQNYTVVKGDSLWKISVEAYNDGTQWPEVYSQNQEVVGDNPDLIYPGQELSLPAGPTK